MKENANWYGLDNQATIYPAVSDNSNTNVFRLTCTLKENINPETLQEAVDISFERFKYYSLTLRRGFFWFYLDPINEKPIVKAESKRPCAKIFDVETKSLLFNVTYFNKNINLEVFHALADGGGAYEFFKTIVYNYLKIAKASELVGKNPVLENRAAPESQREDGFKRHFIPSEKKANKSPKAFVLSSSYIPSDQLNVITMRCPTKQLLTLAKTNDASLTSYLTTVLIMAYYNEAMTKRDIASDVAITVPVDLRGMFPSPTLRNFFSVIDIRYNFSSDPNDFENVLKSVTSQLKEKINPDNFNKILNYNLWAQENFASRLVPLVIKNRVLKIIYKLGESHATTVFSNVGRIVMPPELVPYIDNFNSLLNPTKKNSIKLCITSFENVMMLSFTSNVTTTSVQKYFVRFLRSQGVDTTVTTNRSETYETV